MASNTAGNSGAFKPGDKRINRNGRPRLFDAINPIARALADKNMGKGVKRAKYILLKWASSGDFQQEKAFMEYAYGKIPQAQELSGLCGSPLEIRIIKASQA